MASSQGELIGDRLRTIRLSKNLSQFELANQADVSPNTISNIENHRHYPQSYTIYRIAEALEVSFDVLAFGAERDVEQLELPLLNIEQVKLGARWVQRNEQFAIDPSGQDTDVAASLEPVVQQLHESVARKAGAFSDTARRLDNAIGWHGIVAASERFREGVERPIDEIPSYLGSIYGALLELGSFFDQDLRLQSGIGHSADPLDPEVHRVLSDLIRTAAPWLRRFPTVRELDDEVGAFLTRSELLVPSKEIVSAAEAKLLINSVDAAAISGLLGAAGRGEFQGEKAKTRSVASVRNLLYASATIAAAFLSGAVASNYSQKSILVDRAGNFLAGIETQITKFVADLPEDLRLAMQELMAEIRKHPDIWHLTP